MRDDSAVPTAPERWFDRLEIRVRDEAFAERIGKQLAEGPPDAFGVTDLPKNGLELKLIALAADAVAAVLADYGAAPSRPPLSPDRVHILSAEEFAARIGPRTGGKTQYGHAYLRRNDDWIKFLRILTHELTHRSAFLSIVVTEGPADEPGEDCALILPTGVGLGRAGLPPKRELSFDGLDEAVTEILAREARKRLARTIAGMNAAQRDDLAENIFYPGPIMVTAKLIEAVAGGTQDFRGIRTMLVQDYVSGEARFLDRLAEQDEAAYQAVRTMGPTHADAIQAARRLNWPVLAERIARLRRDDGGRPAAS